jgi:predicted N-formylglutamate amidohydrolase
MRASSALAGLVLERLRNESGLIIDRDEAYSGSDAVDHTIPYHAELRGVVYVEPEIRQETSYEIR